MQTIDLVRFLRSTDCAVASELSSRFDASVRTVRAHIHEANTALKGIASIRFSRQLNGYHLLVHDGRALDVWLGHSESLVSNSNRLSPEGRVAYLINDLIQRTDWVTISDFATLLFISPQSISKDLKAAETIIARYGLRIVKKPRYGIRIEGSEMARRLCLAGYVSQYPNEIDRLALRSDGELAINPGRVTTCIENVLNETDLYLSSVAFSNLVAHVVVALFRITKACYIPLDEQQLSALRDSPEFPIARRIAMNIGHVCKIDVPESEMAYIAIHLAGKKTLVSHVGVDPESSQGELVITQEIWSAVSAALDRIWESFQFDLRSDLELRMNLARHLVPLASRLKYRLRADNPILDQIKLRYPLAFSMALDVGIALEEWSGTQLCEEETGYIALALALALERKRSASPKRNILVVCATGLGTTRLLESAIRRTFGAKIGDIVHCDALHVQGIDFSGIDYVFTTVPLDVSVPVPVQQISCFLDADDISDIDKLLDGSSRETRFLTQLFDEDLFIAHLTGQDRFAILDSMCDRLIKDANVSPKLTDLVIAREEKASTAFGNSIALPHPARAVSDRTRICVGLLDQPVAWGEQEVQIVLLVSIGIDDREALDFFFSRAARLLSNPLKVKRLLETRRFETFIYQFGSTGNAHE
ncbi:transcriptional antiterminator, BglG [Coriobacterium glomerans PW2]|uniref:Transcriptional antiterminator, BglG n=1 Tax=Coriobacterium glomerans (strain ATCC 49209 / DSM 20642 / JCM 10262 / PW2) TaxID=700015 RepID=F2N7E2_CORGP|nr:BglG family transcription antiterminator [Coriobacterium glomerans]AEB06617.1 transcriptional antiterminator, BglG [Coriobacterium glomerans PW2]